MSKLILHPGAPKTATSTLQHLLRVNRTLLSGAGIGLILPEDMRGHPWLGAYLAAYRGETISGMDARTAEFFRPFMERHDHVICTEETLCHDFMPSRKFASGGIDGAERAAALLAAAGASRQQVVLSIRPQADFLTSTYTHFVHRHRETRDFADWFAAEVDADALLWQPAIQAFRDRFGADAVRVVSLALTRQGGMKAYLQAMLDAFGIGHLGLDLDAGRVHNPSPSQRAVHLCRIMNQEIAHPKRSETINSALVETFPVAEFGKFTPEGWTLPEGLARTYAEDHAAAAG